MGETCGLLKKHEENQRGLKDHCPIALCYIGGSIQSSETSAFTFHFGISV